MSNTRRYFLPCVTLLFFPCLVKRFRSEDFNEDLFDELSKYGEIESLNIYDNLADHMLGNVYVQFREEEHAANALKNLTGRFCADQLQCFEVSPLWSGRKFCFCIQQGQSEFVLQHVWI
ncbi:hypothetical protein MKW98_026059 [Papaver atlanticum]|uniref:RRM domain-containing protein n=1 Tax=Papaver atlanticum TaxID=357466 RepID=A0AAD4RXZ4_9MAGN|nr:hypothetical protein MKW98_026059 [Papaver atlanticum]